MNPVQIEIEAGRIIEAWLRCQNEGGIIGVAYGKIIMLKNGHRNKKFHGVQTLTRWQIEKGLTSDQWATLGDKLFELLEKENQCHEPQKP